MPSGCRTDRVVARDDPCLILVAPVPPMAGTGEDPNPSGWVHSKPNGQTNRRLADHPIKALTEPLETPRAQRGCGPPLPTECSPLRSRPNLWGTRTRAGKEALPHGSAESLTAARS